MHVFLKFFIICSLFFLSLAFIQPVITLAGTTCSCTREVCVDPSDQSTCTTTIVGSESSSSCNPATGRSEAGQKCANNGYGSTACYSFPPICDPDDAPTCPVPYANSYSCSNGNCVPSIICPEYTTGVSYATCRANPSCSSTPPTPPPVGSPPCNWTGVSQFECECRAKNGNEYGNNQYCGGSSAHAPRGCSYNAGSTPPSCCCNQTPPPPPPPRYRCTSNSCNLNSNDYPANQQGNYPGDNQCGGNCAKLNCKLIRIDGSQEKSGSKVNNSFACSDLKRSNLNLSNNPVRYKVSCEVEEYLNNVNRPNWRITDIKISADNINASIYEHSAGNSFLTRKVNNQYAEIKELLDPNENNILSGESTSYLTSDVDIKLNMKSPDTPYDRINCDTVLELISSGVREPNGNRYDTYSFSCEGRDDLSLSNDPLIRKDEITPQILDKLGNTINLMNVGPNITWGNLSTSGNNYNTLSVIDSSGKMVIPQNPITYYGPYTKDNPNQTSSTTSSIGSNEPNPNLWHRILFSFKVNSGKDLYEIKNAQNENIMVCGALYDFNRPTEINLVKQMVCIKSNTNLTIAQMVNNAINLINTQTGYSNISANLVPDPNTGDYTSYDINGVNARLKATSYNKPLSSFSKKYEPEFELEFKDNILFKESGYNIVVNVTDGMPIPANGSASIIQNIDTTLPTISKLYEIVSTNKFKTIYVASDDHLLKSHSFYTTPIAFKSDDNVPADSYSSYPTVAVITGNDRYLGFNPIKTVKYNNQEYTYGNSSSGNGASTLNPNSLQSVVVNSPTDVREVTYGFDINRLANIRDPFKVQFGNGIINGNRTWNAEDSFCNIPINLTTDKIDIGSPWLQVKNGNVYVKGSNQDTTKAVNYSVYQLSEDCKLSTNSNKPCPERNEGYVSTYLLQSKSPSNKIGPRYTEQNKSRSNLVVANYPHRLNDIKAYTRGSANTSSGSGSEYANFYDYFESLLSLDVAKGDSSSLKTNTVGCSGLNGLRLVTASGITNITMGNNGSTDLTSALRGLTNTATLNGKNFTPATLSCYGTGLNVFVLNNDLNLNAPLAPVGNPYFTVSDDTLIYVKGNVNISPDIINSNNKKLIIIASGYINIGVGQFKSKNLSIGEYPENDRIDAFLITDSKILTTKEDDKNQDNTDRKVTDQLVINGGVVQSSYNPTSATDGNFLDCPNIATGQLSESDKKYATCFARDLVLLDNLIAPAEQIVFDPYVETVLNPLLGTVNTFINIREVKK